MKKLNRESLPDLTNSQLLQLHEQYEKNLSTLIKIFSVDTGAHFSFFATLPKSQFSACILNFGSKKNWPDEIHKCLNDLINRMASEKWFIESVMEERCTHLSDTLLLDPEYFLN